MDKIKDAMNAKARAGEAGVQSRRIAAQSGREYILQQDAPAAPSAAPTTSSNPAGVLEISLDLPPGERYIPSPMVISFLLACGEGCFWRQEPVPVICGILAQSFLS